MLPASVPRKHSQHYHAAVSSLSSAQPLPEQSQSGPHQLAPSLDLPHPATPPRLARMPTSTPSTLPEPAATFQSPSRASKRLSASHADGTFASPRKRSSKGNLATVNPYLLQSDRLGTLVRSLVSDLESAESWEDFVTSFRGRSYLADDLEKLQHPAVDLLREWRDHGVPAQTSAEPWSAATLDSYVERGCHRSATEHAQFLREEMSEFIDSRFWCVLPYSAVRDLPNLQLSPAAVKEERERKPRLLCDHSWYPVNDTTLPHAPPEAMQFGGALQRIMHQVRHANPRYGPVHMCKFDVKDGYYRMFLNANDCPRLGIILPVYENEEQLIAIPMSTTMGWVQSPPTFCTMSETVADLTNAKQRSSPRDAEPHRMEVHAASQDCIQSDWTPSDKGPADLEADMRLTTSFPTGELAFDSDALGQPSNCPFTRPVGSTDVFVDDFMLLGQGKVRRLGALRRHLMHSVDDMLSQPTPEDQRNEAISLKKLLSGDGGWGTRKLILGWIIDSVRQTVELPPHRKQTLNDIFLELQGTRRVSAKRWRSILGKLRFVSLAIPGSAGLFSALQWAQNKAGNNRVRLNAFVRSNLDAFARLASSLCSRPTHLAELVPELPTLLGATDASRSGMGGVYFDHSGHGQYWRLAFPPDVQAALVTFDNPKGHITNSDLEQAAVIAQLDIMAHSHLVAHATLENMCDNTAAISRSRKGAVSSPGPASYLCQLASDHQRLHRYCHRSQYLPGPVNTMADDCSRMLHLTDAAFHSHLTQHYPLPPSWTQQHLGPEMASLLISALRCKPQTPLLSPSLVAPSAPSSKPGSPSAPNTAKILPCVTSQAKKTDSASSLSSPCAGDAPSHAPGSLSELTQWRNPSRPWARGSPDWVSLIPASKLLEPAHTIRYSLLSSKPSATPMTPALAHTPPTSPLSATSRPAWTSPTRSMAGPTGTPSTSASSASSGSSAPPNTSTATAKAALKPSASKTSPSPSAPAWLPPRTLL